MTTPNNAAALERLEREMRDQLAKGSLTTNSTWVDRWANELATLRACLAPTAQEVPDWLASPCECSAANGIVCAACEAFITNPHIPDAQPVNRRAHPAATLRATLAHEASGADWHWLRTDDWSEIVQAMPLGDDRYATGYQDAMNAVTRKLCSLPRPVINPAQPDALTSQPSGEAVAWRFLDEDGKPTSKWADIDAKPMHYWQGKLRAGPYPGTSIQYAQLLPQDHNDNGKGRDNQRQPQGTTSGGSPDYSRPSHPSADAPGVAVDDGMVFRAMNELRRQEKEVFGEYKTPTNGARKKCLRAALAAALAPKPDGEL